MLRDGTGFSKVIVCCGRVDLRKGILGLTAYVRLNYGLDAMEKGTLFLFCGNCADRIKGILFEGDGMLLLSKVLYGGNRFQWPRSPEEARESTPEQFRRLMDGFAIEGTIKEVFPANVKHFFTSLGKKIFTLYDKEFFTLFGKQFFT